LGYGFEQLWKRLIGLEMCGDGLLYALAIKGDFKKHKVAFDSRKRLVVQIMNALSVSYILFVV